MTTIGVKIHDVTLNIAFDYPRFALYAREHLRGLTFAPFESPDFLIHSTWRQGKWDRQANPFQSSAPLDALGKRMLGNSDELIWLNTLRMRGLQLRFRMNERPRRLEVAYCFDLKPEKLEQNPDYEYKRFFSLMSYLVYYPLIWYLETTRGWTFLHASALATRHGALLIGGLGGVGKTTTCMALLQRDEIELISENIAFSDGQYVYPCYEPIRLNAESLASLGNFSDQVTPMFFPEGLKDKQLFLPETDRLPQKTAPFALFLPRFTSRRHLRELAPANMVERLLAINHLTRELNDYLWYVSALDMNWPVAGLARRRVQAVQKLVSRVKCFELGVDRDAGLDAVVEDVLSVID